VHRQVAHVSPDSRLEQRQIVLTIGRIAKDRPALSAPADHVVAGARIMDMGLPRPADPVRHAMPLVNTSRLTHLHTINELAGEPWSISGLAWRLLIPQVDGSEMA
jgi:hypothetical protein